MATQGGPATKIVVTVSGGFIGDHIVHNNLVRSDRGEVRAIDYKPLSDWHQLFSEVDNLRRDCCSRSWGRALFFSSSACVYAAEKQTKAEVMPLRDPTHTPPCIRTATAGEAIQRANVQSFPGKIMT